MAVVDAVRDVRVRTRPRRPIRRANATSSPVNRGQTLWSGWLIALLPITGVTMVTWTGDGAIGGGPGLLYTAAAVASSVLLLLVARSHGEHVQRDLRQIQRLIRRASVGDDPDTFPQIDDPVARLVAQDCLEVAHRLRADQDNLRQQLDAARYELERKRGEIAEASVEVSRLRSETNVLRDFGGGINRQLGPAQLCGHLITSLPVEVEFKQASAFLLSDDGGDLVPVAVREPPKPAMYGDFLKQIPAGQIVLCATLASWVLQTGKSAYVPDAAVDSRCSAATTRFHSLLLVPLRIKDRTVGIIQLAHERTAAYGRNEETIMSSLANQAAIAIDNVRLAQEAMQVEALRELDRMKSELLSTVSHELRTPLASIKGYAGSLLRRDVQWDEPTEREFLQIIDEESDRLGDLIEDLLQMSRIESGMLRVDVQPIKLSRIVQRVVKKARSANRGTPHTFSANFPADFPDVIADPIRIEQVVRNLLENAVKYSPDGGQISVTGEVAPNSVTISVRDQGIGIAPEDLPRVFERFFRAEGEAVKRVGGTGLGLSICRGIIEKHTGRLWAESTPGEGSTFYFSLPLPAPQAVPDKTT